MATSPPINIKRVLCLNNSGLLIELDSEEAALWLKSAQTCSALVNNLGIQAIIKDQLFPILVPYVPISSTLEDLATLHDIKVENGIAAGSLIQAKWVKPAYKCAIDQRVVHAVFTLCDPMVANLLVQDGVYHKQEKFFPRKDKKEAIHCMRCQLWGHIARDCNANEDTCSDPHRTTECNNPNKLYCVSCGTHDHASHSRTCKEF
ncbi:hypothetical protein PAXRUDRAFT_162552 [Paxillus rubicundulus Ve08.2h10]|uniref:CCHC-type domain-containing protein n=1 Tax=Paxillus rubicundulus Ve08.2h10 TaxID=930991 RepID=A0A0D0C7S7_9AGAM|nr:hypothetical protein PAXRUDRAFT_162552 [Paxillus rubicundulus Ve08.2h10]